MKAKMITERIAPFTATDVLTAIGMAEEHPFKDHIAAELAATASIAAPKGFYLALPIDAVGERSVTVGGVPLLSPTLARALKGEHTAYLLLATCGRELAEHAAAKSDMIAKFALDAIMEYDQRQMTAAVKRAVAAAAGAPDVELAGPGDLFDWDIREQKKLFTLFGDDAAAVGVALNPNYLMTPLKTVTGICLPERS